MPNDLRLRIGAEVATIELGGTPAQIAAVLERYAKSLGISTEGTPTERMTAFLEHVRDDVRRRSRDVHRAQLEEANRAAIAATLDSENGI